MDMKALKRASDGDANQMIAVRKGLLADAYARIKELEQRGSYVRMTSEELEIDDATDTIEG